MRQIGAIVRRLYAEELKSAGNKPRSANGRGSRAKRKLSRLKKALFKRRSVVWAMGLAAVLAVLFVFAETIFQFNRLTSWYTTVSARRADVDRELKRRANLIPNLVYAVSKYASYEQGVFKYVSDAREALKMVRSGDTPKTKISGVLGELLPRLVALAEEYPDLKTSRAIQDLIAQLGETENRIAEAKKDYNKAAETYNQYRTIVPGNLFGFVLGFSLVEYIGMDEAVEVPTIDLDVSESGAAGAAEE